MSKAETGVSVEPKGDMITDVASHLLMVGKIVKLLKPFSSHVKLAILDVTRNLVIYEEEVRKRGQAGMEQREKL